MNSPSLPGAAGDGLYGIAECMQREARTTASATGSAAIPGVMECLGRIARQAERDGGAAAFALAVGIGAASVALGDAAHDEQSQSRALYAQAFVDAIEAAEYPLEFALRDALALVVDPYQQIAGFVEDFNRDGDLAGRVLDRVLQQIGDG